MQCGITVGADKAYDTRGFVRACRDMKVSHAFTPTMAACNLIRLRNLAASAG